MANCLMCNRPQRQGISLWDMVNFQPFSPIIVCDRCQSAFTAIEKNKACPGCSRLQKDDQFCEDCQKWRLSYPEEFIQHQSCYIYNEALKDWLHNYKIKGDSRLALVFKAKLTEIYQDYSDYPLKMDFQDFCCYLILTFCAFDQFENALSLPCLIIALTCT